MSLSETSSKPSTHLSVHDDAGPRTIDVAAHPPAGVRPARTLGPWFIVALVIVFGLAMTFVAQRKPPTVSASGAPPPVVTVGVSRAVERVIPRRLVVTGSISAWDPLPVGASANGLRIEQVTVEEGDQVRKGEVLAVLDASVLRAQRRQLEARLTASRATLPKVMQPNRPQEISGIESALRQAEQNAHQQEAQLVQMRANYENAKKNHARYKQLLAQGFVTTKEFEDRETELDRTRALELAAQDAVRAGRFAVEQARQRLALATAGGRAEDVVIARANGDEIEALLQQVDAQIAQTVVRAPDDGLVVKRDAHIGDITAMNRTLFVLVRRNQLELRAQIPEVDLSRVRVGQRVRLTTVAGTPLGADPARALAGEAQTSGAVYGRVWLISPSIDPQTRLGTARIAIPTTLGLVPGMFVRAEIDGGSQRALLVPSRAVLGASEERFVFVLDGTTVHKTSVRTGVRVGSDVQVTRGLSVGQQVVVDGGGFLSDGDTVEVGPSPSPSSSASASGSER